MHDPADSPAFERMLERIKTQGATPEATGFALDRRYYAVPDRRPGENRAQHRARLKRERREAKAR